MISFLYKNWLESRGDRANTSTRYLNEIDWTLKITSRCRVLLFKIMKFRVARLLILYNPKITGRCYYKEIKRIHPGNLSKLPRRKKMFALDENCFFRAGGWILKSPLTNRFHVHPSSKSYCHKINEVKDGSIKFILEGYCSGRGYLVVFPLLFSEVLFWAAIAVGYN